MRIYDVNACMLFFSKYIVHCVCHVYARSPVFTSN